MQNSDAITLERPLLRGWFHVCAAVAATLGTGLLLLMAESPQAYVGGALFGASLILLYATSAVYHRVTWKPKLRQVVRRLDHAMIFVLIGGTYTPFCLVVLQLGWGIPILSVIWGLAGAGILLKMLWITAPKWLSVTLYTTLGWLAVIGSSQLVAWFTLSPLILLIIGGALYTLGGTTYALGRPNPWPRVFGYHEIFHLLVIAGSALHYWLIAIYVLPN